jgi:hypothetical protein
MVSTSMKAVSTSCGVMMGARLVYLSRTFATPNNKRCGAMMGRRFWAAIAKRACASGE